jgi:two-component system, OmpR family, sensor histidine kinase VicK
VYSDIRHIGELSKDGVFIYNIEQKEFIYVNSPFAQIFNLTTESLLQAPKTILAYIRSEDNYYLRRCFIELQQKGAINSTEFRAHLPNETVTHIRCDAFVMEDAYAIAGFVRNITKEKQHEDYIINYGARKDTLLDMMTHNLSGPLSLSKNVLRWVQETYKDNTPGAISSQLQIIQASTQECLDIVNDFLKEEHLESERIYVKKTRFDVLQRIVATLDKLVATNKNKKFRLITKLENVNINTDSVKFFQIIHNLVSNAIKFTPNNGEIDILVDEWETSFVFCVKDNGIGIPPPLHASLFEKRTPSGRSGLNNELSTGLGLSIVKNLVELIGGKVWFESEENKGSAFYIELPKE